MKLSVVIAVYNEEDNIAPLIERLETGLSGIDHEVIFVDDGSTDDTVKNIKKYATPDITLVALAKNAGQSSALKAGIDQAKGEYIATIDGDLQNDPVDIPALLDIIETEDWDVVAGKRENRQDNAVLRKLPSNIANWMIRTLTKVRLEDYGCSLRVFKSQVAKNLNLYGELHRFIPVLVSLQGARTKQIPVSHHPRIHGESKYGLKRTYKVLVDLMLMLFFQKYASRPMHLFGGSGLFMFGAGVLINFYLLIEKLLGHDIWGRPLLVLGVILLIGGLQLITFGIIAELIMRVYYESRGRTPYIIREIYEPNRKAALAG